MVLRENNVPAHVAVRRLQSPHRASVPFDSDDVRAAVEQILQEIGFASCLKPGGRTVIKPNFVADRDREHRLDDRQLAAVCTNPVVLDTVVRAAWQGMQRRGQIHIVDSPIEAADIEAALERLHIPQLLRAWQRDGIEVGFFDLRDFRFTRHFWVDSVTLAGRSWNLGWLRRQAIAGDPAGYVQVDLGEASYFERAFRQMDRLRFHASRWGSLRRWHTRGRHIYSIARRVLQADCVVSLPKLKTHKKCGLSLSIKNSIGFSNRKEWIPHFRKGAPPFGDEFDRRVGFSARFARRLRRVPLPGGHSLVINVVPISSSPPPIEGGNWPGNDVVWRAARDVTTAVIYADQHGTLQRSPQRNFVALIDGLIAGEGQGPLRPTPRVAGLLIGGREPLTVDTVAARIAGLPIAPLPILSADVHPDFPLGANCGTAIDQVLSAHCDAVLSPPLKLPHRWSSALTGNNGR